MKRNCRRNCWWLGVGILSLTACGDGGTDSIADFDPDAVSGAVFDAPPQDDDAEGQPSEENADDAARALAKGDDPQATAFSGDDPFGAAAMLAGGPPDHDPSMEDSASEIYFGWVADQDPEFEAQYQDVAFSLLASFQYDEYDYATFDENDPEAGTGKTNNVIPPEVLEFDGKKVRLRGFMNPLAFDKKGVTSFALVRYQSGCCFGVMPAMNEWVSVEMAEDERADYAPAFPVVVYGTLSVGEELKKGFVVSLLRLEADLVVTPD